MTMPSPRSALAGGITAGGGERAASVEAKDGAGQEALLGMKAIIKRWLVEKSQYV